MNIKENLESEVNRDLEANCSDNGQGGLVERITDKAPASFHRSNLPETSFNANGNLSSRPVTCNPSLFKITGLQCLVVDCGVKCPANPNKGLHGQIEVINEVENDSSGGSAGGPRLRGTADPALPCQNRNNSITSNNSESDKIIERFLSSKAYGAKQALSLSVNATQFIDTIGIENCGFFTVTFKDNLRWWEKDDWNEASRRMNSFITNFFPKVFGENWMRVAEAQERGAIHYHILVDCRNDIRTGVDFEAFKKRDYRTASEYLRGLWKQIRENAPKYGIGRCELMPLRTKSKTVGDYVGKYIGKSIHLGKVKALGGRRIEYSRGFKSIRVFMNMRWSYASVGLVGKDQCEKMGMSYGETFKVSAWRYLVERLAGAVGAVDLDALKEKLGNKWAYHLNKARKGGYENQYIENCRRFFVVKVPWDCWGRMKGYQTMINWNNQTRAQRIRQLTLWEMKWQSQ